MSIERTTGERKKKMVSWRQQKKIKNKKITEYQVVRFSRKRELLFVIVTAT